MLSGRTTIEKDRGLPLHGKADSWLNYAYSNLSCWPRIAWMEAGTVCCFQSVRGSYEEICVMYRYIAFIDHAHIRQCPGPTADSAD